MIIKNIKAIISEHISKNSVKYFFLALCFFCGIAAGAVFVTVLPFEKATALGGAIDSFLNELYQKGANWHQTFKSSFWGNIKIFLFLYICGYFSLMVPAIYGQMIAKGFVIGFTIGFMSCFYGAKGILFVALSVIPQSVVLIPSLSVMSVFSINFAISRRAARKNILLRKEGNREIIKYTYSYLAFFVLIMITTLVDTFVIPVFVKMIASMF